MEHESSLLNITAITCCQFAGNHRKDQLSCCMSLLHAYSLLSLLHNVLSYCELSCL